MQGVALHHRSTLCLQRDNKRHSNQKYIKKGSRFISTSIVQAGTPHPYLGQNLWTHTHAQKLLPRYHEKQLLYNIRSNERITTSSEPHRTVHTNYSNRAVLQHTSNGGAHICEPEQPYKLYILSCHYIQLQCTWKMMHTTLLGRMPGPRRPIHVRLCIKKNQNAPIIPSEHPPVRRKNVTFRWDQRLQIQK